MSYVGGKFKYDLFISYAYASQSDDPDVEEEDVELFRNWNRYVIFRLVQKLRLGLNARPGARKFTCFIDHRELDSAVPLSDELVENARSSAVLLALVSPYFLQSDYCQAELKAFLQQAEADGRGLRPCVIREVQSIEGCEHLWPDELRDSAGKIVYRGERFFERLNGLPISLDEFAEKGTISGLITLQPKLMAAVRERIEETHQKLEAEAERLRLLGETVAPPPPPEPPAPPQQALQPAEELALPQTGTGASLRTEPPAPPQAPPRAGTPPEDEGSQSAQPPPDTSRPGRPQELKTLYLQADPCDRDSWSQIREQLEQLEEVALVNPEQLNAPVDDVTLIASFQTRRFEMLLNSHGLLLLHVRSDDTMEMQLTSAQFAISTLSQLKRNMPCAVVDEGEIDNPRLERLGIKRVSTKEPGWPAVVLERLGLSAAGTA